MRTHRAQQQAERSCDAEALDAQWHVQAEAAHTDPRAARHPVGNAAVMGIAVGDEADSACGVRGGSVEDADSALWVARDEGVLWEHLAEEADAFLVELLPRNSDVAVL